MMNKPPRLYLSPPHMGGAELAAVQQAFASNWIAPVGPDINGFEQEMCAYTGAPHAVALSSGTAALHLALLACGVRPGDDVYCSGFTFAGSAFPITYVQANPVFIDSEECSWNMDPELLRAALRERTGRGHRAGAVIAVHLYGQSADLQTLKNICDEYSVPLIEDAAESLGGFCGNAHTGTIGAFGVLSFNGNKIITTSGGGMLVGKDADKISLIRHLSTQARDPFPYYEHTMVGYNYRMSNIVAAIGRGQLSVIEERVARRRYIREQYRLLLSKCSGVSFIPNDVYGRGNCWLTCIVLEVPGFAEELRIALEAENIESRPLWKPMHLQPVFANTAVFSSGVSERLFKTGLCLPSGTSMTDADIERVASVIVRKIQGQG